jgi:DNA invertase Pin-like site-specific DNA recombinase
MAQNMRVGYARTSTLDQQAGFEAQLRELKAAGCEKVFQEQVSSVGKREQLEAALDFVREGDILSVTRLDRLARSTQHLLDIVERVKRKGANLQILGLGIDMSTATGQLVDLYDNRGDSVLRARDDAGAPARRDRQGESRASIQGAQANGTGQDR